MSEPYKILARSLLNKTPEELWSNLSGSIELIDDEGVTKLCTYKEVIASRYFWKLHLSYDTLPLLKRHFISSHYSNGIFTSSTHRKLLSTILRDIVYLILKENATPKNIEPILKNIVEIENEFYNAMVSMVPEYYTSVDITDFVEVLTNKKVISSSSVLESNPIQENLISHNNLISKLLNDNRLFKDNSLVKAFRSGSVNKNQVLQCVGARGYVTELDNTTFKIPVKRGFAKGLTDIYDLAAESRSGAKALYFSDSALKNSEYFARRLQLLTMSLTKIIPGDCGSTEYFNWNIKPPVYEGDRMLYKGDLPYLVGKIYMDSETNTLKVITNSEEDKSLIGTTIKLRSPFHCKHPDKSAICSTCFGELSKNIPEHSNIGHLSSVSMTQQITQSVLSTKHLDFSTIMNKIVLGYTLAKYLKVSRGGSGYSIKKEINRAGLKLLISEKELTGLADIHMTDDISKLSPSRLCRIETIILEVDGPKGIMKVPLDVYKDNRKAVFAFKFMEYIKEHGYTTDNHGNIVFDISEWKLDPFIELPAAQYSYSDHGSKIASMIEQTVNNLGDSKTKLTPDYVATELFDLVNSKLFVNIVFLEIIVYAATVADIYNRNYDLSRHYDNPELYNGTSLIQNRSLSAALGFKAVVARMLDPKSFDPTNRPNHVLDTLFKPNEVYLDKTRND